MISVEPEHEGAAKRMLIFSVVLFAFLFHVSQWGSDSIRIVYLKAATTLGWASSDDWSSLARVCEERIKPGCLESALKGKANNSRLVSDYVRLGDFQRVQKRHAEALLSYNTGLMIDATTVDPKLFYGIARSYESTGETEKALAYYAKAIEIKPEVIQVTVTESYVKLLKRLGREDQAKEVLTEVRKRGNSDSLFSYL